jgi:hypothetical protein
VSVGVRHESPFGENPLSYRLGLFSLLHTSFHRSHCIMRPGLVQSVALASISRFVCLASWLRSLAVFIRTIGFDQAICLSSRLASIINRVCRQDWLRSRFLFFWHHGFDHSLCFSGIMASIHACVCHDFWLRSRKLFVTEPGFDPRICLSGNLASI